MVILGIDPGTRRIGFGVIERKGSALSLVDAGLLKITSKNDAEALLETKKGLSELIERHKPSLIAVEKLYFSKNQKTALAVAHARGVILATAKEYGLPIQEYSPTEIKMGLAGYGHADKQAILKMVRLLLKAPSLSVIDDTSDALAIAIVGSKPALA